jgi:prepilin-type N-terminal cleavage/methylation domain-containing protein
MMLTTRRILTPTRRGMTLIELLAGLVVLGTVLASVTIARGRFVRQWSEAQQRLEATRAVDAMVAGWLSGPRAKVPIGVRGTVPGMKQHVWQTTVRPDKAAEAVGASVVRLEVFDRADADTARRMPVVAIELLVAGPGGARR